MAFVPIFAETIQLSGQFLLVLGLIALGALVIAVGGFTATCVSAYRAGKGQSNAMVAFTILGVLQLLLPVLANSPAPLILFVVYATCFAAGKASPPEPISTSISNPSIEITHE
jgi:hypothetical protein